MDLRRLLCLLVASSLGIACADFEKGRAALRAKRYDEALKEFEADAKRGNALALEALGHMYSGGMGVEQDKKRGALFWQLAALQGLASSQYMLGLCYGTGEGAPRDDDLAKEWLRKSARRGYEPAKKTLAENYPEVSLEPATGPWLEVNKREGGFLMHGQVEGTRWAFVLPGTELMPLGDTAIMMVDGVLLQLRSVSRKEFAPEAGEMLDAHRAYEQKYQRDHFQDATFDTHGMCKGGMVGYRDWMTTYADNKSWKHHVYVTFEVGPNSVMLVNSAYGTDEEKQKVARLIGNTCRTFKTDW